MPSHTSDTFETRLDRYADIIVDTGLHIVPGDAFTLNVTEEALPLARKIVDKAYRRGAHRVYVKLGDDAMTLSKYLHAEDEAFASVPDYDVAVEVARAEAGTHRLSVVSPNPELLKDVDPERVAAWQKVSSRAFKPLHAITMSNGVKWCVAAVPGEAWAKQVFPDQPADDAIKALWELIFHAVRADLDEPVAAWAAHNETLKRREAALNEARFVSLHYEGPGTDFTVGLVEDHVWVGGASPYGDDQTFMANIPTEEVFTMPDRRRAEGTLRATMPLSLHGRLVKDFAFTFEDGKVVAMEAGEGEEVLARLLETDEGARYLGEVALVDVDSPIAQSGVLYRNTLFDENAACHFALGAAYAENLKDAASLSDEARAAKGMNDSLIHVDFMVGSDALNITGTTADGREVPVMRNGHIVI